MKKTGIVIVSHVYEIAEGIHRLLQQVAADVDIQVIGGVDQKEVGTSYDTALEAINNNSAENILAFYDLGSAKMNLEMAMEMSDKTIKIYDVPVVEGAYTAATLLQAGVDQESIEAQLEEMHMVK
ncbi:dihydroxyacetone kinase phosphoryl donor subunit DhaM [Facklamia miroungae]|uniref:phosphoenolpyruvate--glycerone phosphotransferase n=1 Tax=Facklamia miroungae TaxID=120956 RepID=A0A1G7QDJ3_9LACT|nr:dihydroxyacetone kinase phosphoryl donor subunit DhaM [Facklamia miroungae]NKZ28908.1 PTS-dependent dihydroxyacetone kinase phosphotransferase subunit DhaM [Facklamia miroungae]SDF96548.1 dihydroxyacetone kinase, phosphotransfer subunit [Facklamia miroungae]